MLFKVKLLAPMKAEKGKENFDGDRGKETKPRVAEWRYGPAQLWYDMLGVDETGEGFDYGFRLKEVCLISITVKFPLLTIALVLMFISHNSNTCQLYNITGLIRPGVGSSNTNHGWFTLQLPIFVSWLLKF